MSWKDELPEAIRDNASLKDVDSIESLASQFINAQGLIGNSVRIPGEDAGEEDRAKFRSRVMEIDETLGLKLDLENEEAVNDTWTQLGRPLEGKYELPEGAELPEETLALYVQQAGEMGYTQKQFEAGFNKLVSTYAEQEQAVDKAKEALSKHWGEALGERLEKIKVHMEASKMPSELIDKIGKGEVGVELAEYVYQLVEAVGENEVKLAGIEGGKGRGGRLSPAEAQAKIDEIYNNPKHPYFDASAGAAHERALAHMDELANAAYIEG